jgi:hypothetical protein
MNIRAANSHFKFPSYKATEEIRKNFSFIPSFLSFLFFLLFLSFTSALLTYLLT